MNRLQRFSCGVVLLTLLGGTSPSQGFIFLEDGTDSLYGLDEASGTATLIATLPTAAYRGLAYDVEADLLYTLSASGQLVCVDIDKGTSATVFTASGFSGTFTDLMWDKKDGVFLTIRRVGNSASLHTISGSGASWTMDSGVSLTGVTIPFVNSDISLAMDSTGTVYASTSAGAFGSLDRSSGAFTSLGTIPTQIRALTGSATSEGSLHGIRNSDRTLYSISIDLAAIPPVVASAVGGPIGALSTPTNVQGITWVPERAWIGDLPVVKININDVTLGDPVASTPTGCEVQNTGSNAVDVSNIGVAFDYPDLNLTIITSQLSGTLQPGQRMVITEPFVGFTPPPNTLYFPALPPSPPTVGPVIVTLRGLNNVVLDQVRIAGATPQASSLRTAAGVFRGEIPRYLSPTAVSCERLTNLDTDSASDWTLQNTHSLGLENRSSGIRGTETVPIPTVLISEIDDSPGFIELSNPGGADAALRGAFFAVSNAQGATIQTIAPFPGVTNLPPGGFLVLGFGATPPAEMPPNTPYFDISGSAQGGAAIGTDEYSLALHDRLGRVIDLVRVTRADGRVVHNHPRSGAHPADFQGAAIRLPNSGAASLARSNAFGDTNLGSNWRSVYQRTMGSQNGGFSSGPGLGASFDVRVNDGGGGGLTIIFNAQASRAGAFYSFLYSFGHDPSPGGFLGLGPDAIGNWLITRATPPFSGFLDADGSARIDLPPGTIPPGIDIDARFVLEMPVGVFVAITEVLEFDT